MKKTIKFVAWPDKTRKYWGLTKDRKAIIEKTSYRNGEYHYFGTWMDTNEKFDSPSCFFTDEDTELVMQKICTTNKI